MCIIGRRELGLTAFLLSCAGLLLGGLSGNGLGIEWNPKLIDWGPYVIGPGITPSLDITPPTTEISIEGTLGDNAWYTSGVTITLTATDKGGSGLDKTWTPISSTTVYGWPLPSTRLL